ncbi:MAG: hypothetical protein QOF70_5996 [Acetobacteraceae bacterium]|nr:hypothetical protein [Acetobacteraceae bacterium]
MERVRKVHAAVYPGECLGGEGRVFQCDAWQAGERTQGLGELAHGIGVDAAKHPFCFEQDRGADEYVVSVNQGPDPG